MANHCDCGKLLILFGAFCFGTACDDKRNLYPLISLYFSPAHESASQKGILMPKHHASKDQKIEHPATSFENPKDVVRDEDLSHDEKKKVLDTWEQDARQLLTASNEGMPGSEEGIDPHDQHRLGEVVRAKGKLGQKPKHKPSH